MPAYDNTNRGVLFKNDKQGNEKRPDYKGKIDVNGVEYSLSAWIQTSKTGSKFMSLRVEPRRDRQPEPAPAQADLPTNTEMDSGCINPPGVEKDDVPF